MTLCFIDTEATGVHPDRQVYEIAMIRDEEGYGERSFFVEVDLSNADPFGLNVGRFYERHPYGRYLAGLDSSPAFRALNEPGPRMVSEGGAAEIVARWTHGAHLVGAVPDFDARTLDPLLRKHGLIPAWHYHLIDIEAMAVGYLYALGARVDGEDPESALGLPWKSDDLARMCGVEPPSDDERHTALGDARWAQRWYEAITGQGGEEK